ncbi:glycosyltransferase family 9 protein [Campylobacter sp. 19-13652]|uniref:glycosyltransferase family 9 protein n=1 Tax=Campylobacter sp. 19-13652 TaxID=2840180 RepID=UPI001C768DC3|nr:glycosyltransferase family 9 protein [Campylobacter sp. 19-13652]BCX79887.1 hypothetical protein LBC_13490 [Campylobacter sp. 19-13652]
MRVFIELPTWLGDAVMASGGLNLLLASLGGDIPFARWQDSADKMGDASVASSHSATLEATLSPAGNYPAQSEVGLNLIYTNQSQQAATPSRCDTSTHHVPQSERVQNGANLNLTPQQNASQAPRQSKPSQLSFVLFGSAVASELYAPLPGCELALSDTSRHARFRLASLVRTYRSLGEFDAAFSFRSSLASRVALRFLRTKHRFSFRRDKSSTAHQAQRYFDFIKASLLSLQKRGFLNLNQAFFGDEAELKNASQPAINQGAKNSHIFLGTPQMSQPEPKKATSQTSKPQQANSGQALNLINHAQPESQLNLKAARQASQLNLTHPQLFLPFAPHKFARPTLGINAGASYGSAKRWLPERFASVAAELAGQFEIVIFGGKAESEICGEIERLLAQNGVAAKNLAGKTSIAKLCSLIAGLGLFITNDSGPMHIAAAYKVPTIAIFGSTKDDETSPFDNPNARIVKLNPPLKCMPCMKRACPLKTHECMDKVTAQMVLDEARRLLKISQI